MKTTALLLTAVLTTALTTRPVCALDVWEHAIVDTAEHLGLNLFVEPLSEDSLHDIVRPFAESTPMDGAVRAGGGIEFDGGTFGFLGAEPDGRKQLRVAVLGQAGDGRSDNALASSFTGRFPGGRFAFFAWEDGSVLSFLVGDDEGGHGLGAVSSDDPAAALATVFIGFFQSALNFPGSVEVENASSQWVDGLDFLAWQRLRFLGNFDLEELF